MRAPFPYFGGKSRVAAQVWERFGDVANYVEPFAGSLAVLLARPTPPRIETVNDADCYLSNFWRAVKADPEAVAEWADWPVNEADLHARHRWLVGRAEFRERMKSDPDFFDPKVAGWWAWGLCLWIGDGWCRQRGDGAPSEQLPHLSNAGMGLHRNSSRTSATRGWGSIGSSRTSATRGGLNTSRASSLLSLRAFATSAWRVATGPAS